MSQNRFIEDCLDQLVQAIGAEAYEQFSDYMQAKIERKLRERDRVWQERVKQVEADALENDREWREKATCVIDEAKKLMHQVDTGQVCLLTASEYDLFVLLKTAAQKQGLNLLA